jgi:hypothetical protein
MRLEKDQLNGTKTAATQDFTHCPGSAQAEPGIGD